MTTDTECCPCAGPAAATAAATRAAADHPPAPGTAAGGRGRRRQPIGVRSVDRASAVGAAVRGGRGRGVPGQVEAQSQAEAG